MAYDEDFKRFESSFWELSRKTGMLWNKIFKETFPGSQSKIMYMLKQRGPLKMSEIADSLQLTAGAVTTAANHLIEQKYVERIPSTNDRRIIQLQLTSSGENILKHLEDKGRTKLQYVFQHVKADDLIWMEQLFTKAMTNIEALEQKK